MLSGIALHGHTRAVTRVKFNKDSDLLFTTSKDSSPHVWNAETGERLGTYEGHQGMTFSLRKFGFDLCVICGITFSPMLL